MSGTSVIFDVSFRKRQVRLRAPAKSANHHTSSYPDHRITYFSVQAGQVIILWKLSVGYRLIVSTQLATQAGPPCCLPCLSSRRCAALSFHLGI